MSTRIDCEQLHPGIAVSDVPGSIEFYTRKLGFQLGFTYDEPPTFAGIRLDKVEIHLAQGKPNPTGLSMIADSYAAKGCADGYQAAGWQRMN